MVESLTGAQLDRVMRPKVEAALLLDELTADLNLSAFVLFSSVAGADRQRPDRATTRPPTPSLDALAARRRAAGRPATSLAWGLWADATGMTGSLADDQLARLARMGAAPLTADLGLDLFDQAQARDEALLVPVRLDLAALRAQARAGLLPALLRGLVRMPVRRAQAGGSLAQRLAEVPAADREGLVLDLVQEQAAAVLGHASAAAVDPGRAFKDLGFDSLSAVELRNRLTQVTGLRLPSTLVFDHPTAAALARYVLTEAGGADTADTARPQVPARRRRAEADEPLAIVGMSCRYPGGVGSPDELWDLVAAGRDAITALPADRWDVERLYDPDPEHLGTVYARGGGFLAGAGDFDADFFGIGPREALAMDPQQRLLLERPGRPSKDAGIDPVTLRGIRHRRVLRRRPLRTTAHIGAAAPEVEGFRLTGAPPAWCPAGSRTPGV